MVLPCLDVSAEGVELPRVFRNRIGGFGEELKAVLQRRPVNRARPARAKVVPNVGEHFVVRQLIWNPYPFVWVTQEPADSANHRACNLQCGGGVAREQHACFIEARAQREGRWAVLTIFTAFFLAELGDKTMLATVTLATTNEPIGTWLGSTVGMVAADALAVGAGTLLASRLSGCWIKVFAAASFVLFGLLLIREGVGQL